MKQNWKTRYVVLCNLSEALYFQLKMELQYLTHGSKLTNVYKDIKRGKNLDRW